MTKIEDMKNLVNQVQLIGRLGADAEVRETKTGKKVANFSIATDESYRDANGKKVDNTQWHRLTAWDKLAEVAQNHFKKGKQLAITARLVPNSYEDKDGVKHFTTDIVVNDFMFLGKKDD